MPRPYPKEFRDDVVAIALRREPSFAQIAKDLGSPSRVQNWVKKAAIEDGVKPGLTQAQAEELREPKKRNRLFEQENEVLTDEKSPDGHPFGGGHRRSQRSAPGFWTEAIHWVCR